jgi:hypothetical protein
MAESTLTLNIETLVDRARALWRDASSRETTARVELFAKASLRSKASRDLAENRATIDHTHESGLAVRVMRPGHDRAGFAAASGLSNDILRWALDTARASGANASARAPAPSDAIPGERWDLDPETERPAEDELSSAIVSHTNLEWVEAGTTFEVLIGADGWLAARRRNRVWALDRRSGTRLTAQRGFTRWEDLLDRACDESSVDGHSSPKDLGVLALTPDASSSVVAALVDLFHGAEAPQRTSYGVGWTVTDEPGRPEGLAGGYFDDAGFPAMPRYLATDGVWMGGIHGPGTIRRASYREPPTESATNLVVPAGGAISLPARAAVARRCRVLPMSDELWVLELDVRCTDVEGGWDRRWIRVKPLSLLKACVSRLGGARVTPSGSIVPWLLFDGLATAGDE